MLSGAKHLWLPLVMSSEVACQAVALCEGWRQPMAKSKNISAGFLGCATLRSE